VPAHPIGFKALSNRQRTPEAKQQISETSAAIQRMVVRQKQTGGSIAEYERLIAVSHYLNRLCRGLFTETPETTLLRAARAEADTRYRQILGEAKGVCDTGLPWVSVQARKAAAKYPAVKHRVELLIRRQVNSEIQAAIRRIEKTKRYQNVCDQIEVEKRARRLFQANVERLDRELKQTTAPDNSVVPRGWPMRWTNGVYSPMQCPHEWMPRPKTPSLEQLERGGKADNARLWSDLGMPPTPQGKKLLHAELREDRRDKLVGELLHRQNRKPERLRTFADLAMHRGQFWHQCDIMKVRAENADK
jgi:hypothetical protein